jgi:hypothetical protein
MVSEAGNAQLLGPEMSTTRYHLEAESDDDKKGRVAARQKHF